VKKAWVYLLDSLAVNAQHSFQTLVDSETISLLNELMEIESTECIKSRLRRILAKFKSGIASRVDILITRQTTEDISFYDSVHMLIRRTSNSWHYGHYSVDYLLPISNESITTNDVQTLPNSNDLPFHT
jgi:hypothetical protein